MKKHLSITIASILVLSAPGIAKAQQFTITAAVGGVPTPAFSVGSITYENFDGPQPAPWAPVQWSFVPTAAIVTGTEYGAVQPYFSGSTANYFEENPTVGLDNTPYVFVGRDGSFTITFGTPQSYLGLLWGAVAQQNMLFFYDSAGTQIGVVSGSDVLAANGSIVADDPGQNGTAYVNITSQTPFSSVEFWNTPNGGYVPFDLDDVAYAQVVPEPASLSLLAFGVFGIALLRQRQQTYSQHSAC